MHFLYKRREFITLLGGAAAAWPLSARAQQPERMRRIGVLMSLAADDPQGPARAEAFLQGLQQLGWTDSRNVRIDTRWGGGDPDRVIVGQPLPAATRVEVVAQCRNDKRLNLGGGYAADHPGGGGFPCSTARET
jgi:hypothetical protein